MLTENLYELANAIVLQACRDYKVAYKQKDKSKCMTLERFFLSDYFCLLTRDKVSGSAVIKELRKQVDEQYRMLKRRRMDKYERL